MAEQNVFKQSGNDEEPKIQLRETVARRREENKKDDPALTIRHALKHDVLIVVDMQKVPAAGPDAEKIHLLLSVFSGITVFSILPGSDIGVRLKRLGLGSSPEFFHTRDSVFTEDLMKFLNEKHADKVYLTGVYSSASLEKAATEGATSGFDVKVVEDACISTDKDLGPSTTTESLRRVIGKENIVTVSSLIGAK